MEKKFENLAKSPLGFINGNNFTLERKGEKIAKELAGKFHLKIN